MKATPKGYKIAATLQMPGTDWMRIDKDDIRRADNHVQILTPDKETILFSYDNDIIRPTDVFLNALKEGKGSAFED